MSFPLDDVKEVLGQIVILETDSATLRWLDSHLRAALAEIERMESQNEKDRQTASREIERAHQMAQRSSTRAEQAEARAAKLEREVVTVCLGDQLHEDADNNLHIIADSIRKLNDRAAALQQERDSAEEQCAEHQHGENEALNRTERLTEALRKAADRLEDAANVIQEDGVSQPDQWFTAASEARATLREEA